MEEKNVKQFKKFVAGFRVLTSKVQKDNQIQSKNLKETNQVLEACKKRILKLYLDNETLNYRTTGRIAQMSKSF